ncbi:putative RNA-directed DNA polymerase from transposon X-element [Trichonephila clavipes]|nr:putative RNA-directed DNA polymerase from transposon X-element [Trichonephila clavipes]
MSRTPVSGKSYASAARKSTSDKCMQCTVGTDNSSDSVTPTNPEVIAKSKSNSPPKTKVIAKPPSKSPPPVKKTIIKRTQSDSPRRPKSRRARQQDQRQTLIRIPKKISRDFLRKIEEDTLTGDCSDDDEALMDIQSGPSTSSSGGGANGDASPTGGVCLFTSNLYPSNVTSHIFTGCGCTDSHPFFSHSLLCLFTTQRCYATSGFESISQLPAPFILLGDFNGHSSLWGHDDTNSRGRQIEQLISDHCLCLLNNYEKTYFQAPTRTFHSLDLAICTPSLLPLLNFEVDQDLHNSDHFPLLVSHVNAIPKTSNFHRKLGKPWWNSACEQAKKEQRRKWGIFRRYPTTDNLIAFKRAKALARKIRRQSQSILDPIWVFDHIINYQSTVVEKGQSSE